MFVWNNIRYLIQLASKSNWSNGIFGEHIDFANGHRITRTITYLRAANGFSVSLAEVESGALKQETNEEIEMREYEMRDWYDRFMAIYEGGIAASSTEEKSTMRTMFMDFSTVYRRCMGLVNSRLKANAAIDEA